MKEIALRDYGSAVPRFMEKVERQADGCWLWMAAGHPTGYGRFGIASREVEFAHRASWRLFRGEIPRGLYVCHRCDVRRCVNPSHLFLGTHADNMKDASRKARVIIPRASYASDETHQVAKLTNEQVRQIRASSESSKNLAARFGVVPSTIWAAKTHRTFKDVR